MGSFLKYLLLIVVTLVVLATLTDGLLTPFLAVGAIYGVIWYRSKKRKEDETRDGLALIEKRKAQNPGSYQRFEGHGGIVELRQNDLIISRHGLGSFLTQGIKGEKVIPYSSLTAVQYKNAQRQMAGYIQFSVKGEIASRRGIWDATLDENTVMFTFEQAPEFEKLRSDIEVRIGTAGAANVSTNSFADELTKLADLRDRGVLDDGEFQEQKAKLRAAG